MISAIARASAAPENMSRAMARDSTEVAQAPAAWITRPVEQVGQVGGKAAPDAAGKEHRKADQDRPAPAVTVRDRPDHELADREHRKEDGDG